MCISPVTLKRPRDEWQDTDKYSTVTRVVECGKCHKCLGKRRNAWSFRLYHQALYSDSACFMTLTYGKNIEEGWGEDPPTSFNGIYTLKKRDFQLFMKKLRKKSNSKISYYAVGEYGTINYRPHYHAIVFNLDRHLLVNSLRVARTIWKKGNVDIARCNLASISYVVGYLLKGVWEPQTDDDDRLPEFSLMSKKLGSQYLTDNIYHYHLDRMETSVMHPSGFRIALPRYYKDQIFSVEEKAELYSLNQEINQMDWQEFVNIDYEYKRKIIERDIKKHNKNLKTKRAVL